MLSLPLTLMGRWLIPHISCIPLSGRGLRAAAAVKLVAGRPAQLRWCLNVVHVHAIVQFHLGPVKQRCIGPSSNAILQQAETLKLSSAAEDRLRGGAQPLGHTTHPHSSQLTAATPCTAGSTGHVHRLQHLAAQGVWGL